MGRIPPAAVLLAAALAASAAAQSDQTPVFRTGVELVRVDVRVTDAEGRPIADLRPDEVQVVEEGAARPVLLFQHVRAPEGDYADAAQRTIAAQVSTNQGSPRGHVYVLVFDEAHITPGREQRARRAAERFLRASVRPGDRVALYALPGPGPQIGFTIDVARVARGLRAVRGAADETGKGATGSMRTEEAYEIVRGNTVVLDRIANQVSNASSDTRASGSGTRFDTEEDRASMLRAVTEDARAIVSRADGDSRRFLSTLADVVRTLRQVDGRKAVVLFSEGFQVDNVTREIQQVAAAAAESYSVVYALDLNPRGVEASDDTPRGGTAVTEVLDRLQSIGSLAAETGGTLVTDANGQIDRALARIAETTEDYYLVGFTPAGAGRDDGYHRIRVTVTRPGASVAVRKGYAAGPRATPADRRRTIEAALAAPFSQQGLRVEYTTYTLRGGDGTERVVLSLAAELPVDPSRTARADVVYVARDVDTGRVAASGSDTITLPGTPDRPGATVGTGVYRVQFDLPAGTYLMRAVVREPGGLLGSADRRFQVRALDGPDVTASDLVLGSADARGLPVRAAAYPSEVLTGVFELYARAERQLESVAVTADLVPVGGADEAVSVRADLEPTRSSNGVTSRGVRLELPLEGVPPGEYVVRARIRNGADTIGERLRDVTVKSGERRRDPPGTAPRAEPRHVLQSEIARRLIGDVQARAAQGGALASAARSAATGDWPAVDAALGGEANRSADAQLLRGLAGVARGDYTRAVEALREAERQGTAGAAVLFVAGWANAGSGRDADAITAWRGAVFEDPTLVPAYLALIDAYERLGHRDLALQVVRSGLRRMPGSPELLNRLAQLESEKVERPW